MRRRAKIADNFAPKLKAAESRLRQFEERAERPPEVREQKIDVRLGGARTGKRAVIIEDLELHGLTDPFDVELWFGERVAVLGANGVGKSHFLRLLAGDESVDHDGSWRLGAGVVPGHFNQTHEHPSGPGARCSTSSTTTTSCAARRWACCAATSCRAAPTSRSRRSSGGQQARFQILLLELSGATLLLLDEPTDNLDLVSAEALEPGLAEFTGTVDRRHARPLVPARLRPLPGVRRRLLGHRPHGGPARLAMKCRARRSESRPVWGLRVAAASSASCWMTVRWQLAGHTRNMRSPLASTNTRNG